MWYYRSMRKLLGILILVGVLLTPGVLLIILTGAILPTLIIYGVVAVFVGLIYVGVELIS